MAASEKRQLILDLLARNKMGGDTAAAARDIDKVGDAAEEASRDTEKFGKESVIAGQGAARLGKESDKTGRQVGKLSAEIELAKRELESLARSFADTDDAAERLDISKGIRKGENDIRRLTKSKSLLEDLLPDPNPADTRKWTQKLGDQIKSGLEAFKGSLPLLGTGLGAALAPGLAVTLASAVTGGVGLGGIIGGVAIAAQDPAVTAKATDIGTRFSKSVQDSAKNAFLGPVLESLDQLGKLADRSAPKLGRIFDLTAPSVQHLTDNVTRLGDSLLDDLEYAAGKSGSSINALGDLVEHTGESVGNLVATLSDNADSGASAIGLLDKGIQQTIGDVGTILDVLGKLYGVFGSVNDKVTELTGGLGILQALDPVEPFRLLYDGIKGADEEMGTFTRHVPPAVDATGKLTESSENAAKAADGHRDALVGLSNELKAETDPVFGLLNAQQKLKNAQDDVAESTKEHGRNSAETKAALRDLALAAIDLQGRAGGLAGSFNGNLTPAMRSTLKAAGLTEDQINDIAGEFKSAKKAGDAYARTYAATAKLTTVYKTIYSTNNENSPGVGSAVRDRRASGGPIMRGTPYLVGENGPEVVVPNAAGRVLSAASSRGFASAGGSPVGGGGGWSAGPMTVKLELVGQHEVVSAFRGLIRTANLLQDGQVAS